MTRSTDALNDHYAARYLEDDERAPLPPRSIAEEDALLAAEAIDASDLPSAYHALAGALMVDPFDARWQALLSCALDADPSYVVEGPTWSPSAGHEALRAYAQHRAGELTKAVVTLTYGAYDPRLRFAEAWGLRWLREDGAVERATVPAVLRFLEALVDRYPDPPHVDPSARPALDGALAVLSGAVAIAGATDAAVVLEGKLLARAGRMDEAIAVMERHAEARPSMMTATAAAMAHRRSGDFEGAIRWFRRAADLSPTSELCLLDIGDLCIERGDFARALAAYEEALERKAGHAWAGPSALYCRVRLTGDPTALEELRYMANAGPCTCGMAGVLAQISGGYSYEDQRQRAESLMRALDPAFVPEHRPHAH